MFSILEFHKIGNDEILFASGDEYEIRGWNLQSDGKHVQVYKLVGQYNRISNILVTPDSQYLIRYSEQVALVSTGISD